MKKYLLLPAIFILLLTGCSSQNNKIRDEIEKDSENYYGLLEKITSKKGNFSYKVKNNNNYIITEKNNDATLTIDVIIEYVNEKHPERGGYSYIDKISIETKTEEYKEALKNILEETYKDTKFTYKEKNNAYIIDIDNTEDEAYFKYLKTQYDTINNATSKELNEMIDNGTLLIQ